MYPLWCPHAAQHRRVPWAASGAGRLLATLLQALACCPGRLGKARGGCVGLEAGAGAGRGFHTAAREGESAAGCVTQPHPARPALPRSPSPSALACQETPSAGASSAGSRGSASTPASHPAPLTKVSFLPSLPSQSFVPHGSITAPSKMPTGRPCPGLRHPRQSLTQHRGEWDTCTKAQAASPSTFLPAAPRISRLPWLANTGMCHTASSSPDASPYPGSSASSSGPQSHSLPSQGIKTPAEQFATGSTRAEDQDGTSFARPPS